MHKKNWNNEIQTLNKNKVGGQYEYPESLFMFLYRLKQIFHLGYRQEQGFLQALK
ncbi:transposase [Candidatus Woesearchaeota archaeon]|nr:transposase [Candidatus Woesearchaeota archaeon]